MRRIIYAIIHLIVKSLFKFFFRFKVHGQEHIPLRGGVIIASNHLSFLDPPLIGAAVPRQAYYMARHDLFSFPLWGAFLRFINAFPVYRERLDRRAIKRAIDYLRAGEVIVLFPEGTRSLSGELLPPLPGVGLIAWEGGASIVPACIKGSDKALPPGARFIKFKKVEIIFGEPFSPGKLFFEAPAKRELYLKISRQIMSEISKLKNFKTQDSC